MISYKKFTSSIIKEVKEIYKQESWNAYLNDDKKLINAFDNALYILGAFHNGKLIGFIYQSFNMKKIENMNMVCYIK